MSIHARTDPSSFQQEIGLYGALRLEIRTHFLPVVPSRGLPLTSDS